MLKDVVKSNVDGEVRRIMKMGKLHFGYKRYVVTVNSKTKCNKRVSLGEEKETTSNTN